MYMHMHMHMYIHECTDVHCVLIPLSFHVENLLSGQWRSANHQGQEVQPKYFCVSPTSVTFKSYYNGVQDSLKGMDELLEGTYFPCLFIYFMLVFKNTTFLVGILSKSRGQVLRLTVVMHMLFNIDSFEQPLPTQVGEAAIKAAVNLIQLACQQTAYIAGKGVLQEEMDKCTEASDLVCMQPQSAYQCCMIGYT